MLCLTTLLIYAFRELALQLRIRQCLMPIADRLKIHIGCMAGGPPDSANTTASAAPQDAWLSDPEPQVCT